MVVQKMFWDDPYLQTAAATVTGVWGDKVTLDRTIAFAFSGGQESDAGTIGGFLITAAVKQEKEIIYQLAGQHTLAVGDRVQVDIDWERRYKLMRLHFAAELVLELMNQLYQEPEKIGAHIGADKARIDFYWDGNISAVFSTLKEHVKSLVTSNLPIQSYFLDAEQELRCWEIAGFAQVSCGGTHLRYTGEVGELHLKRNNIGKGKERIEIYLA